MVVIWMPSLWTANIRQDRTGTPSSSTVQAPHTPCSQPACAPVRPNWSRRQSSNVVRGSTSAERISPLILSSTSMLALSLRVGDCADRQGRGHAPPIFGRGVQVGERFDLPQLILKRGSDNGLL